MHPTDCVLDLPYPDVEASGKNIRYANLLLNDYAGPNSELTAITQYFYQYFIVKAKDYDLSQSLECISIVEMRHMEMLGELITLLGGDPLLRTYSQGRTVYWRGNNISPEKNIQRFLTGNIEAEKKAIAAYRMRIRQIQDPKVQALLERIILDEEHHITLFEQYRAALAE